MKRFRDDGSGEPGGGAPALPVSRPYLAPIDRLGYVSVRSKFALAMLLSGAWFAFTAWLALPWMRDLAQLASWPIALVVVGGIALVPGLMNAFLATSLLLDQRPPHRALHRYPGISILIAAYNEESSIVDTLQSLARQNYPGQFEALVVDDGSKDDTARVVAA